MKRHLIRRGVRFSVLLFAWVAAACCALRPATAEEPYEQFLEKLVDSGLYDMALEYIDQMRGGTLVSAEQRQVMPYDEGRILVESALAQRDPAAAIRQLDRARDRFTEFIKSNSAHPLLASAEMQLGNVLVGRARMVLAQAKRPSQSANKDKLMGQARELLLEAQQVFTAAEAKLAGRWQKLKGFIDPKKTREIAERDQVRGDLILARLFAAQVLQEIAKTYTAGSDEATKTLQAAADKFDELYAKYRKLAAGATARLKQGQCYQEMGDMQRALGYYAQVTGLPNDVQVRKHKATAMHLVMQCLTSDSLKRYEEAVTKGTEWLNQAKGAEERLPDWLAVRYYTALALQFYAEGLPPEEAPRRKSALADARKHASFVSKYASEYRDRAKRLAQKIAGVEGGEQVEPTNFAEAREAGDKALQAWQGLEAKIKNAGLLDDQENVPEYQQQAQAAREQAVKYFQLAMELRDEETPIEEVNLVRYYLTFLAYSAGRYYDAAVLGEFLATKYPEAAGARSAAKVALAGYQEEYQRSPEGEREFDKLQMVKLAEYITGRWPSEPEADEAWVVLMSIAIREGDLVRAVEYLGRIPTESPRRGESELAAGQAMWGAYFAGAGLADAERPPQERLDELVAQAKQTLENGIGRMRAPVEAGTGDVTPTLANAALSLAQIYVGSGEPDKTISLLNDPKIGPMTLVAAKSPAAALRGFDIETYKAALRAHVALHDLEKAEQTMNALEKLVGASGDANSAAVLTNIYIVLGRELEDQVTRLRTDPSKSEDLAKLSRGFELFLERIAGRQTGNTMSSLNWVSETFFGLARGYDAGGELSPEAKTYYEKAHENDQRILRDAKSDADFAPGDALLAVQLRMARAQRRLGEFKQAMEHLVAVLKQQPLLLDAQREAAQTYQEWGRHQEKYYGSAILGSRKIKGKDGRDELLVWGWSRLANMVQRDKRYSDIYHEARYNLAKTRMDQALRKSGEEKTKGLERAEFDIIITSRLKPELGGPEWRKKYDLLLKTIQLALNKQPTGLAPDQSASASAAGQPGRGPVSP